MATKEPTRQQLADRLRLIRAMQLQLRQQARDLGYEIAKANRALLECGTQTPKQGVKA
jgi:hypothetical protein